MFIKLTEERTHRALYVDVGRIIYFAEIQDAGELDGKSVIELDANLRESHNVIESCIEIYNLIKSIRKVYQ